MPDAFGNLTANEKLAAQIEALGAPPPSMSPYGAPPSAVEQTAPSNFGSGFLNSAYNAAFSAPGLMGANLAGTAMGPLGTLGIGVARGALSNAEMSARGLTPGFGSFMQGALGMDPVNRAMAELSAMSPNDPHGGMVARSTNPYSGLEGFSGLGTPTNDALGLGLPGFIGGFRPSLPNPPGYGYQRPGAPPGNTPGVDPGVSAADAVAGLEAAAAEAGISASDAAAAAAASDAAAAGIGAGEASEGPSQGDAADGSDSGDGSGFYKGGKVTRKRMIGPNPPGPDEGYIAAQSGEYVVPRSKVNSMIEAGRKKRGKDNLKRGAR